MEYHICEIKRSDKAATAQMNNLLLQEGIMQDPHLTYSAGIFDDEGNLVATGSIFANTLRCIAVSSDHQGEDLMSQIVTHLIEKQMELGNSHLFLFTKCSTSSFFAGIGFHEIARVPGKLVFMENKRSGFQDYIANLQKVAGSCTEQTAIVMNANPFTLGHMHLLEKASEENAQVVCFVVSEDTSLVPFSARMQMVKAAEGKLCNVNVIPGGEYIISAATFPSYFLKEPDVVSASHAALDCQLFVKIAKALNITSRYVGEEPFSNVTGIYNRVLGEILPENGIKLNIVPRAEADGKPISASHVRQLIHDGKLDDIKSLVPDTTFSFLKSEEGQQICRKIQLADDVIHH